MPVNFVPLFVAGRAGAMVIDVPNSSTEPGTGVILFSQNLPRTDNQLWELRLTGEHDAAHPPNPFVFIINKHSGMALTVPSRPRFDQGAAVVQEPLHNGANQKWLQFSPPSQPGKFVFASDWSGGLVIAVKGSETDQPNQLWQTSD